MIEVVDTRSDPAGWLAELRERLEQSRERRLLWVAGAAAYTRQWAEAAVAPVDPDSMLWVGDRECNEAGAVIKPSQAGQYLGREYSVLVWDGRCGLHPDGFAALAGTLRGGGILILLTPEPGLWPRYDDPDYSRLASAPQVKQFLARLAGILESDPWVLSIRQNGSHGPSLPALPEPEPQKTLQLPTADQQRALAAIIKVRRGHRRRPLVITADRGRGKSAILGIAAATLIEQEALTIAVTAAKPAALATFWRHTKATLEDFDGYSKVQGSFNQAADSISRGRGSIRFYPPAVLLEMQPEVDLLLVDEAAAIPVPLLKMLLERYPRIVFATTVHGYEGSGRGFALRFRDHLASAAPGWQALTLVEPVRWAAEDPLELLLNRMLLLDAELPDLGSEAGDMGAPELVPWPRSQRASDEHRLSEVFGLLVNAHYQTTPDDLRLLLDDRDSHCWLALQDGVLAGAIWVMAEGGLSPSLADAVRRGHRRSRGHLLPQALAAYGGDSEAAVLTYWRVVRIAVHPALRRQGLGRMLLERAMENAAIAGIDIVGTSFGASPDLVDFWRHCGLDCLRLGLRRDAASGAHSLMLGRGLTAAGQQLCTGQRQRFAEHWPGLLTTELRGLEPALVWQLSPDWCPPGLRWCAQDLLEAEDFASGSRPFALSLMPLQRLTWRCVTGFSALSQAERILWCRAVVQQIPESGWQAEGLVKGRKEGYLTLQGIAERLLAALGD